MKYSTLLEYLEYCCSVLLYCTGEDLLNCRYLGPLWNRDGRCIKDQGRKSAGQNTSMPETRVREMGEVRREHDTNSSHQTFTPSPKALAFLG